MSAQRPDAPRLGGQQQGQLVGREAGEDPRCVERGAAGRRRPGQAVAERRIGGRRVDELGRRRGDHVDAGAEEPLVVRHRAGAAFGSARGVDDAIRSEADERVGVVGRDDADRIDAGQLTGIAGLVKMA